MKDSFKTNFNFVFNVIIIMSLFTFGFVWADTNGVWSNAEDVKPGTFGTDEEAGDYEFPRNVTIQGETNAEGSLNANNELCVDGECYTTWGEVCNNWVQTNSVN